MNMSIGCPMVEGPVEIVKLELLQPRMIDVARRMDMSSSLNEGKLGEDDVLVVFFVAERRCQGLLRTRAGTERRAVGLTRRQRCLRGLRTTKFGPKHGFIRFLLASA